MALFWSKKSKSEKPAKVAKVSPGRSTGSSGQTGAAKASKSVKAVKAPKKEMVLSTGTPSGSFVGADAILRPHITEKAGLAAQQNNVYTFQVAKDANKPTIARAVFSLYKVKPIKIAVINLPAKSVFVKGRWGTASGTRKAMVTLKKGDVINFV